MLRSIPGSLRRCVLAAVVTLSLAATAHAAPEGGEVVAGSGRITIDGRLTSILQDSHALAIDWRSFDIAADETVRFRQPSADAIALNRVLGGDPTEIFGRLEANGRVALINSRGILFSETATVDVAALFASGLEVSVDEFLAGRARLTAAPGDGGFVVNRGLIEAATSVTLLGRQVTNTGAEAWIAADVIRLVGADAAVLTFDDAGLIGIEVDAAVAANPGGAAAAVTNRGRLSGRRVLLRAEVAGDVFAAAVNNDGLIEARGIDTAGGVIRLIGAGADVVAGGTLDASSDAYRGGRIEIEGETGYVRGRLDADGATGGEIRIGGERVALEGTATLTASGRLGGGSIHIGGGWRGAGGTARAPDAIYVGADTMLAANATDRGDGGEVVVYAGGTTRFFGRIEARGGAAGGDGGRVETSGAGGLIAAGLVDTRAPNGAAGQYLLDPADIEIGDDKVTDIGGDGDPFRPDAGVDEAFLDVDTLTANLGTGNVTVQTTNQGAAGDADGTITITADIDLDGSDGNTLTLLADADIVLANGIEIAADTDSADSTHIELTADGDIALGTDSRIDSGGGGIELTADGDIALGAASRIDSGGGDIALTGVDVDNLGNVDAGAGDIAVVTGRGDLDSDSTLGTLTSSAAIRIAGGGGNDTFRVQGPAGGASMTVNGGGGDNRVVTSSADQTFTLGAATAQFSLPDIEFSNIQHLHGAGSANHLLGNGNAQTFTAPDAGQVSVNGVLFDGFDTVVGGGGNDRLAGSGDFALTGVGGEVSHQSVLFQALASVEAGGGTLTAAAGDSTFSLDGTGSLTTAGLAFDGLAAVDAGAPGPLGNLVIGGAGDDAFSLTGDPGEVGVDGIDFTAIARVQGGGGSNRVVGSAGDDAFTAPGPGQVGVNSMLFDGVDTVVGGGGNDRLTGSGVFALTGVDREVSHRSVLFQALGSVEAGGATLTAAAGDSTFSLDGTGSLTTAGLVFEGLAAVDAGMSGPLGNLLVGGAGDDAFSLTGNPGEVGAGGIDFTAIARVQGGGGADRLLGAAADHDFVVTGDRALAVAGIDFAELDAVIGGGGVNSVTTAGAGDLITLAGDGAVAYRGIAFSELAEVHTVDGILAGSAAADEFGIDAGGRLVTAGLAFDGLAELIGGGPGSGDTLVAGAGDDQFLLSGADGFAYRGIVFHTLDRVAAGAGTNTLAGGPADDAFGIAGANAVTALGVRFEDIAGVDAGAGADTLASSGADAFSVNAAVLSAAGIDFTGIERVSASAGDRLVAAGDGNRFELDAGDSFRYQGLTFAGLGTVEAAGAGNVLAGTAAAERYDVGAPGTVSARGTRFEGIASVLAGGGVDTVAGGSADDVFETAAPNRLATAGIVFQDVEHVDAGAASTGDLLRGTLADDRFEIEGAQSLTFAGIVFENLDEVDGGAGRNTVLGTAASDRVEVSAPRAVHTADLSFTGIDAVIGNGGDDLLVAGGGDDAFVLGTAAGEVRYRDVLFQQWQRVDGGAGVNTVTGSTAAEGWRLTGDNRILVRALDFTGIASVAGGGGADRVVAAAGGSDFLLDGDSRVQGGGIDFDGMSGGVLGGAGDDTFRIAPGFSGDYAIDGGAGANRLIGHAGDEVFSLTGGDGRLRYGSAELTGILTIDGGAGINTLAGTAGADALALTGQGALDVDGMSFAQLDRVLAGGGGDSLTGAAGGNDFVVTGVDVVAAGGIGFESLERLIGGAGDDEFTLEVGASLSGGIGGGGGGDRLTAHGDALEWHVTSLGNRVGGTAFESVETLADFSTRQVSLTSDFDLTFNEDSSIGFSGGDVTRFEYRAIDAMTVDAAAMTIAALAFEDGAVTLSSSGAVAGSGLVAGHLEIDAAGDITLETQVGSIAAASGGGIDIRQPGRIELERLVTDGGAIRVLTDGDQIVTAIGTGSPGSGSVTLRSSLGSLFVSEAGAGSVNIEAGTIDIDALLMIGTVDNPFFLASNSAPRMSALEFVSPILAIGTPRPIARGRRIASLAEVIASSGLRSAVQPYDIDLVLIDPAIFTALLPFSIGSEAIALPHEEPEED